MLSSITSSAVLSWLLIFLTLAQAQRRPNLGARTTQVFNLGEGYSSVQCLWDKETHNKEFVFSRGTPGTLRNALVGVVTGTKGVWMFGMNGATQQKINNFPRSKRGMEDVEKFEEFRKIFGHAILGDEDEYRHENSLPTVDVTLSEFLKHLAERQGRVVHAFVIAREQSDGKAYNHPFIEAIVSRLSRVLGQIEVQWMPVPMTPSPGHERKFALTRTRKTDQTPGHEISLVNESIESLHAFFPDDPVVHYHLQLSSEIKPFEYKPDFVTQLWDYDDEDDTDKTREIVYNFTNEDERVNGKASCEIILPTIPDPKREPPDPSGSITRHDNNHYIYLSLTVMTTYGSWTLMLPSNFKYPYPRSTTNIRSDAGFQKFISTFIKGEDPSIGNDWLTALGEFKVKAQDAARAKLLDVVIVEASASTGKGPELQLSRKLFFHNVLNEMVRMADAVYHVLDTSDWSGELNYFFYPGRARTSVERNNYLIIREHFVDRLTFGMPGSVYQLLYGQNLHVTWEIGLPGTPNAYKRYPPEGMMNYMGHFNIYEEL